MSEEVQPSNRSDVGNVGIVLATVAVLAAVALSATALVFAAGSGSGSESAASGAATEVHVALSEMAISPAAITVAAGGSLMVMNEGSIPHNLTVPEADLSTGDIAGGETADLDVSALEPGTYEVLCTVPGHGDAGMTGSLTVLAAGETGADAGGAASAAAPAEGGMAGMDHGGDDADWAAMDAAMTESMKAFPAATEGSGNQVLEPEILEDGTKHFELTAAITEWEVSPGEVVEAWTYNGMVPGPQIFAEVGDVVEVELINELPMGTDLHLHGINKPHEMDGVAPITQDLVQPGESFTYRFEAETVHVGMYHAHHHSQISVLNGMLGMIYVGDLPLPTGQTVSGITLPDQIDVAQQVPMVLNDAGVIGYSLNGKSFPATEPVVGKQGDWIILHYANEGTQIHPMHLHQMDQIVIAKDGFPLDAPYAADTVNVAPGERYSVLLRLDDPGTWVWHCHILPHVEDEDGMFGMVTALIVE